MTNCFYSTTSITLYKRDESNKMSASSSLYVTMAKKKRCPLGCSRLLLIECKALYGMVTSSSRLAPISFIF